MDEEEARQKEAERTLKRIKGTLHHLDDGSAWEEPISDNEEYQRMKKLVQSGYSHNRYAPVKWLISAFKRPALLVILTIVVLIAIELMQR